MTTRRVAWRRSDEVQADEHCTINLRDSGLSLIGYLYGVSAFWQPVATGTILVLAVGIDSFSRRSVFAWR